MIPALVLTSPSIRAPRPSMAWFAPSPIWSSPLTSATVSGSAPSTIANAGTAGLGIYHAFIQFAGFTFGRTTSDFDTPWKSYPAGGPDTIPGGSNKVTGVNQVAYTAEFGNGVSGSIALQDHTTAGNGQSNLWNTSLHGRRLLVPGDYLPLLLRLPVAYRRCQRLGWYAGS